MSGDDSFRQRPAGALATSHTSLLWHGGGSSHGTKHHSQSSWKGENFFWQTKVVAVETEGISGEAVCPAALLELEATLALGS